MAKQQNTLKCSFLWILQNRRIILLDRLGIEEKKVTKHPYECGGIGTDTEVYNFSEAYSGRLIDVGRGEIYVLGFPESVQRGN